MDSRFGNGSMNSPRIADAMPLPLGLRLMIDFGTVVHGNGSVYGDSPRRLVRVSAAGQRPSRNWPKGPPAPRPTRTIAVP